MTKKNQLRTVKQRVKTAKGRKISSTLWLDRQLNDPYVQLAKKEGYRSRAAYKILELDDKFHFFAKGKTVVDLGAAPGGWTQVAVARCGENKVVAMDLIDMDHIHGSLFLQADFMEDDVPNRLRELIPSKIDILLSDMAPNTTGNTSTDHIRIMMVVEAAAHFAFEILKPGGTFIAKVWQGGTEGETLTLLKKRFTTVKHAKPKASRADSAETYVVATGFKG